MEWLLCLAVIGLMWVLITPTRAEKERDRVFQAVLGDIQVRQTIEALLDVPKYEVIVREILALKDDDK